MGHFRVTHAGYSMFKACTKTVLERTVSMKLGMMKKGHITMRRGHMSHVKPGVNVTCAKALGSRVLPPPISSLFPLYLD